MKFCSECGTELSESTAFCSNCGKEVGSSTNQQGEKPTTNGANRQSQTNDGIGVFIKKHKQLLSIGLGVALVILAGYFTLSFINSSERFVNGVVEAIEEDDYESLVGTMYFSDTEEEISKMK